MVKFTYESLCFFYYKEGGTYMDTFIYQLIAILFPISIIFVMVWFISTSIRKSKQLKRIEQKLSHIVQNNKKEH